MIPEHWSGCTLLAGGAVGACQSSTMRAHATACTPRRRSAPVGVVALGGLAARRREQPVIGVFQTSSQHQIGAALKPAMAGEISLLFQQHPIHFMSKPIAWLIAAGLHPSDLPCICVGSNMLAPLLHELSSSIHQENSTTCYTNFEFGREYQ